MFCSEGAGLGAASCEANPRSAAQRVVVSGDVL